MILQCETYLYIRLKMLEAWSGTSVNGGVIRWKQKALSISLPAWAHYQTEDPHCSHKYPSPLPPPPPPGRDLKGLCRDKGVQKKENTFKAQWCRVLRLIENLREYNVTQYLWVHVLVVRFGGKWDISLEATLRRTQRMGIFWTDEQSMMMGQFTRRLPAGEDSAFHCLINKISPFCS